MAARQQDRKQYQEQVVVVATMVEEEGMSILFTLHHHNAHRSLHERLTDGIYEFPLLLSYIISRFLPHFLQLSYLQIRLR